MKPKAKQRARESITGVDYQILQNQGAIMLALEALTCALCRENTIRQMNVNALQEAVRNTGNLMSASRRKK